MSRTSFFDFEKMLTSLEIEILRRARQASCRPWYKDLSRIYVGDWASLESVDTAKAHGDGKFNQCVIKVVDDKLADIVTFAKTIEAK